MLVNYHFIIIGGGIVGLSTAMQLQLEYPDKKVLVLEKEGKFSDLEVSASARITMN